MFGRFCAEMGSATRRGTRLRLGSGQAMDAAWQRGTEKRRQVWSLRSENGGRSRRTGREKGVSGHA